jgi:hypothetical protein
MDFPPGPLTAQVGLPVSDLLGPRAPDWDVEYTIVAQDGAAIIGELHIRPSVEYAPRPIGATPETVTGWTEQRYPEGGITATLLRRVKANSGIIALAFKAPRFPVRRDEQTGEVIEWKEWPNTFSAAGVRNGRQSRGHPRSDRFLAEVAAAYVVLVAGGPDVIAGLREQLAERGVYYADTGIRELLNKARKRGLLTAAPRGRAGGRLTARALGLLGEA